MILPLLQSDIVDLLDAACKGRIADIKAVNSEEAAVCVVLASGGYPGNYPTGIEISGIEAVEHDAVAMVFHAGTKRENDRLLTNGGRVLGVTALDDTIATAIAKAYQQVDRISFDGMYCRRDIGFKAINRP